MSKPADLAELKARAAEAAKLAKAMSHPNRLLVACQLLEGEQSVSEIEARSGVRQPVLSRELARLRRDGLVSTRRESKMIYYRLADDRLEKLVGALCAAFGASEITRAGERRRTGANGTPKTQRAASAPKEKSP
ncbi:MAG TPA: metalloregulator ArsR/SmtB family transcription factor [Parvularculaceae bacterium]|nr:metalloregulator ArsR/SmtB family transcription factor [Parvularculaceae bacterium]